MPRTAYQYSGEDVPLPNFARSEFRFPDDPCSMQYEFFDTRLPPTVIKRFVTPTPKVWELHEDQVDLALKLVTKIGVCGGYDDWLGNPLWRVSWDGAAPFPL